MKNTFTVKARKMFTDTDPQVIKKAHNITSNMGGFLISYTDEEGKYQRIQLDAETEIIIDGSDDTLFAEETN